MALTNDSRKLQTLMKIGILIIKKPINNESR